MIKSNGNTLHFKAEFRPMPDYHRVSEEFQRVRLHRMMAAAAQATLDDPDALDENGDLINFAIPSNN